MKPRILGSASLSFPLATALAALLTAQSASALDGIWLGTTGDWNNAGTWAGGTIADGTDFTANFTGVDISSDETITLAADLTIGNITFTDAVTSSNNLLITGANLLTLDVTAGVPAINVTQSGRTLTIDSEIAGTDGLQKAGPGVLTLNGSAVNTFTGGLNVNGGILTLDTNNLATPTNLVDSANTVRIDNGALTLTGNVTADTVQTFGGTTLGAGINALNIAKGASATSATLNLGTLTINEGSASTINSGTFWVNSTLPTAEVVNVASITGKTLPGAAGTANWINVNAGLFYRQSANAGAARWVNVDNLGQLVPLPATIAPQGVSGTVNVARQISTANITLTGNAESYGLVVNSNNAARTLNLGTGAYTYTINGIIGVSGTKGIIAPGTGGTVVIGSERNLVINMDNTGGVDINAPIVNNGGGASAVTIASTIPSGTPGNVSFGGANTYTGATYIARGVLSFTNADPFGTTPGTNGTSGITINAGTALSSARTGTNPSTTIAAPITLGAGGNATLRIGQGAANNTHTFNLNGAIGGTTNNLVFTTTTGSFGNGTSLFVLGAAATYTGNTLITTGDGGNNPVSVRAGTGVVNALPTTTVLTFAQVNGGGTGRNFQYDLNGNNQTLAGLDNGGVVPQVRRVQVTNTSSTPATLTINNTSDYTFGGSTVSTSVGTAGSTTRAQIQGNLALVKSGTGTFTLGGTLAGGATAGGNTHTGITTVLGGILVLGETLSIQNSALDTTSSIAGDATNGLRTTVTSLTLGGLAGNKNFADVFTTTAGGYDGLASLTLNPGTGVTHSYAANIGDGAGNLNLTKTGAGTQILTGSNTYTGTTTGSAGVLLATTVAALPGYNVAGKVIFDGGTISVQVGGSGWTTGEVDTLLANATKTSGFLGIDTTNGNLTQWTPFTTTNFGSLGLNKLGANDLTLDQANTFTGTTTVTEGSLTLTNPNALQNSPLVTTGAGTVIFGSGTVLNLGGLSGATGDLATVISNYSTVTAINLDTPVTLPGAVLSYGGIISDGVAGTTLTKNGPGVQALSGANTYTGATQINDGALVFRNTAAKASGTVTASATGSIGLGVNNADPAFYSALDVDALFNANSLAGFVLDPASGVIIDTTAASFDQTIALTAARSLTKNGTNTLTLSQVNTYSGSTSVTAGTLSLTGSLDGGGAVSTVGTSVFSQTSTGVISGAATFTQGSTGTSSLAGTNTYTGVTNVNLGQIAISNAAALGTTDGNTVVASGGRLALGTAGLSVAEPLTITGTGTTATNGAIAFFGGQTGMALTGPITLGGAARFQADGNTGSTLSGGISLGANELTINADGGATQTIDTTAITGTDGSLVKSGAGTLILGAANSYTGATTVNAGILRITNADALGTTAAGSVVNGNINGASNNARIELSGGITVTGESAILNGNGNFFGALQSFSGNNEWAGGVTIGSTGTRIGARTGNTLKVSGVIDSGGNDYGFIVRNDATGTTILSAANTYVGDTTVFVGKLQLDGGDNRLPVASKLILGTGTNSSEFDLNGRSQEVAGLAITIDATAANNSINNSSATLSTLTVNTADSSPSTFPGSINGNLALTKSGTDTLTLSGVNTYSGDTTVNEGILSLTTADSALDANTGNDASTVTIAAGATLDLSYSGTDEVNALFIDGVQKAAGIWGAIGSGAPNEDSNITGTGTLTVATGPSSDNYASWANDPLKGNIPGAPASGDFDNDGISNVIEYALGMNPRVSSQPAGILSGDVITYTKGADAIANGDISWTIETSETLDGGSWTPQVTQSAGDPALTISFTFTPGTPVKNFARLKVTQVP